MVKRKLARFAEMANFKNVVQPKFDEIFQCDYKLKGNWAQDFFRNNSPIVLELGCGKGEYTVGMARKYPEKNFIGIDIKGARIWRGAKTAIEDKISNVAFIRTKIDFINSFFAKNEISEIWLTFSDPQPKKAHKRLSSSRFLGYYQNLLINNGIINLKTDNTDLYKYTLDVIKLNNLEIITNYEDVYAEKNKEDILSIKTFYEQQFLQEEKTIHYIKFKLNTNINLEEPKSE
ncbi:MAG: tRNA (guanosine(46)-N7)-methyltransferase TrmB [Bacteroidota bacterium]|nr:tRNA (guanosine(46)-N7)-methyltransferase TrmB [Bacteroidota bacterium]